MGADKTFRAVYTWIVCLTGVSFFVSLYIDDYEVYRVLREATQAGIPQIFPEDNAETLLVKMENYAGMVQKRCRELRAMGIYKFTENDDDAADNVNLLMSDKHKLMMCKAAGLAGSNVHRTVYALKNEIPDANMVPYTVAKRLLSDLMINSYAGADFEEKLGHYKKIMFIRDPLERLLSAYRTGTTQTEKLYKPKLSFRDYLDNYLAAEHPMVPPWREVWKLCNPCEINYDYIIPLDIFEPGLSAILQSVGAYNITLPSREQTGYKAKSSQEVMSLFYSSMFPKPVLQQLKQKCKIDYYLFYGQKYFSSD